MAAPGLTPQEITLAVLPHVTGGLSLLGSAFIATTVLFSNVKRGKTYHRLLLAMSLSDAIGSFSYFLSTWPIPQVGPGGVGGWSGACEGCSPYHYAAVGNRGTCTAQGWGIQMGTICTAAYNVVLAMHYLLTIRWNFGELRLKRWEPVMLGAPPLIGLGMSLPLIPLDYYNDTNLWCWIKASWEYDDAVQRTYNARWFFAYAPLWAFIAFITLAQAYLWYTVRNIERRSMRYRRFGAASARDRSSQSRSVANQAALYVLGFYATNLPYTVIAATRRFYNPHTADGFLALLAVVTFAPLQGFWNLFVYHRRRIFDAAKTTLLSASTGIDRARRSVIPMGKRANAGNGPDEETGRGIEIVPKDPVDNFQDNKGNSEETGPESGEVKSTEAEDVEDPKLDGDGLPGEDEPFIPSYVSEVYGD